MSHPKPFKKTAALDEILLDTATIIELSPEDRRIAENRYRRLKTYLERDGSALAPYLVDGESLIYAQGSIATSTTIINGTEEERFDVDAVAEIDVPPEWSDSKALDILEEALQGFPHVQKIVRCTRCIQLQFPSMHMDITILDRRDRIPGDRPGEIFHSPDTGAAHRVPSNPWGFTDWFRAVVKPGQELFVEDVRKRREQISKSRLVILDEKENEAVAKADQVDLPPAIPNRLDAQEAVALKLLKRFLNLHYEDLELKKPPSIYLTKRTGDLGFVDGGLAVQLYALGLFVAGPLRAHLASGTRPLEENPSYPADKINDRWPRRGVDGIEDMQVLAEALEYLAERLRIMANAPLDEISKGVDELFGEKVGKEQRRILKDRYDRRNDASEILAKPGTGEVFSPAIVTERAGLKTPPRHHFHPMKLEDDENGEGE